MDIGLIVLAGGKSSRMGEEKALLPFGGTTLMDYLLSKSKDYEFKHRVIVTNRPERFKEADADVISDIHPHEGPLSGIHAGLSRGRCTYYFVISCDMPFVDFRMVHALSRHAKREDLAVVPVCAGYRQPLAALYHRLCVPAIEELLLVRKERGVGALHALVQTRFVEEIFDEASFFNVNTPADYIVARAKEINRRRSVPIISIAAAKSGTGKTTFIRGVIPFLKRAGLRVAVVKSDGHRFTMDHEGKDTWHFAQAGAEAVAIVSGDGYALIRRTEERRELEDVIGLIKDVDVMLIESRTRGIFPIVEIIRDGMTEECITRKEDIVAFVADKSAVPDTRWMIPLNDPEKAAARLRELLR